MNRPAQSLYQLNEGKVFWDPYKHLRVNGVHPHYRFASHERCINRDVPPNPIRHVQRPLEQFQRFSEELFPSSEFTIEGSMDSVRYHPLYNGIQPRFDGTKDDPIDLTTTLEDQIFYPPEGEECTAYKTTPQNDSAVILKEPCVVIDPLNPRNMLPYVSPKELAPEEEREREQEYRSWGEYMSSSTDSLDQFHKTYETTKIKRRRKRQSPRIKQRIKSILS